MTGGGAGAGRLRSRDALGTATERLLISLPPGSGSPLSPSSSRCSFDSAVAAGSCPRRGSERPAAVSPTPHAMRAVLPGPVPSGPRVALLLPLLLLLLVAAAGSAQAQAVDLDALCRWVSCVAGAGLRGHADRRPAPPPRESCPRGGRGGAGGCAHRGAGPRSPPCPATCGCHKSGGFVRLPMPSVPVVSCRGQSYGWAFVPLHVSIEVPAAGLRRHPL